MYRTSRHDGMQEHERNTQQATSESRVSHNALVPFVETGSAPMIRPAITNNQQSAFNKKSIPPLLSLGWGLDPFLTMYQSRDTRVSIEELKCDCMYKFDRSRHLSDIL